jgi:GntR family transcriptional regulator/MocR family aminotransferase
MTSPNPRADRMRTKSTSPIIALIPLDEHSAEPLHAQIYRHVRELIRSQQLSPGTRLPSTRTLSEELDVSRTTVLTAFGSLLAEGYITGRTGAGTYVAASIPDKTLNVVADAAVEHPVSRAPEIVVDPRLSRRGQLIAGTDTSWSRPNSARARAFRVGYPALDAFPVQLWSRLVARRWRNPPASLLWYGDPRGYRPLREAIAGYLGTARGVRCDPDQVIIVSGSQQALALAVQVLMDEGDTAWLEDPGYLGARSALEAAGARIAPVPIDDEGIDIAAGMRIAPDPRLIYVTPSHQFTLGPAMSVARRTALLALAGRIGAWVVEDDFDAEFRYAGRPLRALQGMDSDGRVIYVGTFSKVLIPSMRHAYMVVPPSLVDVFASSRVIAGLHAPTIDQAVLADFIDGGHFTRHIRRMRTLYHERRDALIAASAQELDDVIDVRPSDAGMHLIGWLRGAISEHAAVTHAAAADVIVQPLSSYYVGSPRRRALVLGYSGIRPSLIWRGARVLGATLRRAPGGSGGEVRD